MKITTRKSLGIGATFRAGMAIADDPKRGMRGLASEYQIIDIWDESNFEFNLAECEPTGAPQQEPFVK